MVSSSPGLSVAIKERKNGWRKRGTEKFTFSDKELLADPFRKYQFAAINSFFFYTIDLIFLQSYGIAIKNSVLSIKLLLIQIQYKSCFYSQSYSYNYKSYVINNN